MSSSERRSILALLCVLPLAACGFTPVYGPGGTGTAIQDQIEFAVPEGAMEFAFVSRLEDRIGRTDAGRYRMTYAIATTQTALAVSGADDINRINIAGTANFTVSDVASGAVVQSGEVSTFTAYASSGSPVATSAARRDAQARLMTALADQVVARLLTGAGTWP